MRPRFGLMIRVAAVIVILIVPVNVASVAFSATPDEHGPPSGPAGSEAEASAWEPGVVVARPAGGVSRSAPLTPAAHDELVARYLERSERAASAEVREAAASARAAPADDGVSGAEPPTDARAPQSLQSYDDDPCPEDGILDVYACERNQVAARESSTFPSPAVATSDGFKILYTGNRYRSRSTYWGKPGTWAKIPIPAGPPAAPNFCCDQDVVHDPDPNPNRDMTLSSALYLNDALTNGVVRIFVRKDITQPDTCTVTVDPPGTVVPSFPHIAMSNNFLYLTTNNLSNGTSWAGSQVYRLDADDIFSCDPTPSGRVLTHVGNVGPRVFVPAENATTAMFFGAKELDGATDSFRLFRWREADLSPTSVVRTVRNSNFRDPDCRGGVTNTDWIRPEDASGIGFNTRGAVGGGRVTFFWQVGDDADHPQGHLHGVSFRTSDLTVVEQPVIWNPNRCWGFGVISANGTGKLAISIAFGGRRGGGGGAATAAQGYLALDDDEPGIFFGEFLVLVARGDHNPRNGRWGRYLSIRRDHRNPNFWVATSYSLLGGNTSSDHVNARFIACGYVQPK